MSNKKDNDYYKRGERRDKWYKIGMAFGIFLFILGLIIIWLGSPTQVEFTGALCSIGGLFLTIALALIGASDKLIKEGFDRVNKGFERMDKGFERMDEHFERMDRRFEQMFERLDKGFGAVLDALKELPKEIAKHLR